MTLKTPRKPQLTEHNDDFGASKGLEHPPFICVGSIGTSTVVGACGKRQALEECVHGRVKWVHVSLNLCLVLGSGDLRLASILCASVLNVTSYQLCCVILSKDAQIPRASVSSSLLSGLFFL